MNDLLRHLDELRAELRVRDRPDRRAWNRLEAMKSGWTTRPYDDEAFALWQDLLRRAPDDLQAMHHLAIMHHARAFDVEQSPHPRRSDEDWRQADVYWHHLFEADQFWSELADRVDTAPDIVRQVREEFAERVLAVHFDVALDERSLHHRARFHVDSALTGPFPAGMVERVRARAYERASDGIDAAVWASTASQEQLRPAVETVIRYLERDDGHRAALTDLLTLLWRVQSLQVRNANGLTDNHQRDRALDDIRATTRTHLQYMTRLESLLDGASEQDSLVLCELAEWSARTGQASSLREAYDESVDHYERAERTARAGDDPRTEEFRVRRLYAVVRSARVHAADGDKQTARRLLDGIEASERLPGVVLLTRAEAWLLLREIDRSERDVTAAAAIVDRAHTDVPGFDVADPTELRAASERLLAQIARVRWIEKRDACLDDALTAIRADRLGEAVELLDTVLRTDADDAMALFRRAECRVALYEIDTATTDIRRVEQLIGKKGGDDRTREMVAELKKACRERREQITAVGGPQAARLQQAGVKAFHGGRHDEAIERLREARRIAGSSRPKLDHDLAHVLNAKAHHLIDNLPPDPFDGIPGAPTYGVRTDAIRRAEKMLEEAVRLHQNNATIKQNLDVVRRLR